MSKARTSPSCESGECECMGQGHATRVVRVEDRRPGHSASLVAALAARVGQYDVANAALTDLIACAMSQPRPDGQRSN